MVEDLPAGFPHTWLEGFVSLNRSSPTITGTASCGVSKLRLRNNTICGLFLGILLLSTPLCLNEHDKYK